MRVFFPGGTWAYSKDSVLYMYLNFFGFWFPVILHFHFVISFHIYFDFYLELFPNEFNNKY